MREFAHRGNIASERMMEQEKSTASWIARLSSADARAREEAARELFRRGCALAEPALRNWFAEPEFRGLVRAGGSLLTVGIAVTPSRFAEIHASCGRPRMAQVPPDQDAREFEMEFAHGVRLDILTRRNADGEGAIARFLARFGEEIQQVECDVRDVARATQVLRTRFALEPIYPEARSGADDTRVNFFLVPAAEGRKVLIELVEVLARKSRK
jgi:hypothetical protein